MSVTSHHTLCEGLWFSCWELKEGGGWQCSSANGGACQGDQHVWPAVAQFEALSIISLLKLYAFLDYFYQSECREINVVCMDQTLKVPILHHHRFRAVSNNLILHSSWLKSFCCCIICFSFLSFSNWDALTRTYIWCESCPKNACWSWCGGQIRRQKNTLHVSQHNLLLLFTFPVFELSLVNILGAAMSGYPRLKLPIYWLLRHPCPSNFQSMLKLYHVFDLISGLNVGSCISKLLVRLFIWMIQIVGTKLVWRHLLSPLLSPSLCNWLPTLVIKDQWWVRRGPVGSRQ